MDQAAADRARSSINRVGQVVTFQRMDKATPQGVVASATVKAAVEGYKPEELVNGITQGSRKIVVSKLDLAAAGFPVPPTKGDRIQLAGPRVVTINTVDPDHREYQGCYEISATGV